MTDNPTDGSKHFLAYVEADLKKDRVFRVLTHYEILKLKAEQWHNKIKAALSL